jgi:hypothetical protein
MHNLVFQLNFIATTIACILIVDSALQLNFRSDSPPDYIPMENLYYIL